MTVTRLGKLVIVVGAATVLASFFLAPRLVYIFIAILLVAAIVALLGSSPVARARGSVRYGEQAERQNGIATR